jgi:hypothetical protein
MTVPSPGCWVLRDDGGRGWQLPVIKTCGKARTRGGEDALQDSQRGQGRASVFQTRQTAGQPSQDAPGVPANT